MKNNEHSVTFSFVSHEGCHVKSKILSLSQILENRINFPLGKTLFILTH